MFCIDNFECAACGWKSRIQSKVSKHVKEFPNCLFTEQSYIYLKQQNIGNEKHE